MWRTVLIIFFVIVADVITKLLTVSYIPNIAEGFYTYPYGGVGVFRDFLGIEFSLVYLHNTGAAWGVFSNFSTILFILRCCLVLGILGYIFRFSKTRKHNYPLSLVVGGAIGNIIDFVAYGHVIDMLHFKFWNYEYPVFNIADVAIFIGMVWLLVISFRSKTTHE
jgi:signal peptidase II